MDSHFDIPNTMVNGLAANSKESKLPAHSLEVSEKSFDLQKEKLEMAMLRKTQGIHAPLCMRMERRSVSKVGHLPFLPRHNASLEVLTGRDEEIGIEDIFGSKQFPEKMGQPHVMAEKYLK